jgi:glycosyltransferase involved in cell wall biosynthesis
MPLVSVIVPNYNHACFLRQRLDSIFNQTFQDFEVILLDDCSTDDSRTILAEYARRPQVSHYVVNEHNSGSPFRQWKKGLDLAQGKYVWIAESDDWADARFLETLVKALLSENGVGLVYSQSHIVDIYGNSFKSPLLWTDDLDKERWKSDFLAEGKNEIMQFLCMKNTIQNASAVVFEKSFFPMEKMDVLFEYRMAGDWFVWICILEKTRLKYISKRLNYFRHSQNNSRIHDTPEKIQRRAVEGMMILNYLKDEDLVSRTLYGHLLYGNLARWQRSFTGGKLRRFFHLKRFSFFEYAPFSIRVFFKLLFFV